MLRKIVNIDEELCDGCGLCVPECHEGALQIIDSKARLISICIKRYIFCCWYFRGCLSRSGIGTRSKTCRFFYC